MIGGWWFWISIVLTLLLCFIFHQVQLCPTDEVLLQRCRCQSSFNGILIDCSGFDFLDTVRLLKANRNQLGLMQELIFQNASIVRLGPAQFNGLYIKKLDLSSNGIESVDRGAFAGLQDVLQILALRDNRLRNVPTDALSGLGSLLQLDVSHNQIGDLPSQTIRGTAKLFDVNLASNQICFVDERAFENIKLSLQTLNLGANCLDKVPASAIRGFSQLLALHLHENSITRLDALQIMNLPLLNLINLSGNRIDSVHRQAFLNVPNLKFMYLKDNALRSIAAADLRHFEKLELLDLSRNRLQSLTTGTFADMPRLAQVYLGGNEIGEIQPNAFINSSIVILLLSDNELVRLSQDMFTGLSYLQQLSLKNNKIAFIAQNAFYQMPSLVVLDLSHNLLTTLPASAFLAQLNMYLLDLSHNAMTSVPYNSLNQRIVTVVLQENPLVCTERVHVIQQGVGLFVPGSPDRVCGVIDGAGDPNNAGNAVDPTLTGTNFGNGGLISALNKTNRGLTGQTGLGPPQTLTSDSVNSRFLPGTDPAAARFNPDAAGNSRSSIATNVVGGLPRNNQNLGPGAGPVNRGGGANGPDNRFIQIPFPGTRKTNNNRNNPTGNRPVQQPNGNNRQLGSSRNGGQSRGPGAVAIPGPQTIQPITTRPNVNNNNRNQNNRGQGARGGGGGGGPADWLDPNDNPEVVGRGPDRVVKTQNGNNGRGPNIIQIPFPGRGGGGATRQGNRGNPNTNFPTVLIGPGGVNRGGGAQQFTASFTTHGPDSHGPGGTHQIVPLGGGFNASGNLPSNIITTGDIPWPGAGNSNLRPAVPNDENAIGIGGGPLRPGQLPDRNNLGNNNINNRNNNNINNKDIDSNIITNNRNAGASAGDTTIASNDPTAKSTLTASTIIAVALTVVVVVLLVVFVTLCIVRSKARRNGRAVGFGRKSSSHSSSASRTSAYVAAQAAQVNYNVGDSGGGSKGQGTTNGGTTSNTPYGSGTYMRQSPPRPPTGTSNIGDAATGTSLGTTGNAWLYAPGTYTAAGPFSYHK